MKKISILYINTQYFTFANLISYVSTGLTVLMNILINITELIACFLHIIVAEWSWMKWETITLSDASTFLNQHTHTYVTEVHVNTVSIAVWMMAD